MKYPRFLVAFSAIFIGFVLRFDGTDSQGSARPTGEFPNILILYADDLGYGDLSSYNPNSRIPTPHLDRLAGEGMAFSDAHSSSGICTPSRYALLTGRYHWRKFHGIVQAFGESVFSKEELTLPEMLKARGYDTAAIGKWHLGWDWEAVRNPDAVPRGDIRGRPIWGPEAFDWSRPIPDGPLAHGFDHYFGDTVINFPPYCWINDDRVVEPPDRMLDTSLWGPVKEGNVECRPGPMISGWDPYNNLPTTSAKGVRYIHEQAKSDRPFFLCFAFPSPHAPIIPGDAFDGTSAAGPYGDYVCETDDVCGRLLQALEDSGQAGNTLVIFTSDNGPEHYAYPRDAQFDHWSAAPFRGLKRDIYEGGHRVPFIVRWPGVVAEGAASDALVSQIDLMATIAACVDYTLPEDQAVDSLNQLPVLTGKSASVRQTHVHNTLERSWAIRHDNWVLIDADTGYISRQDDAWFEKHFYPPDNDLPVELYRLDHDPGQRFNVADSFPEVVTELKGMLARIRDQGFSAPRSASMTTTQPRHLVDEQ